MERDLNLIYKNILKSLQPEVGEVRVPVTVDGGLKRIPIIEVINLKKGTAFGLIGPGDLIPQKPFDLVGSYTLKKSFVRVSRLVVMHTWEATGLAYEDFGDGLPGGGLQFGLQIYVNEKPLFDERIKATKDYMKYAYDTDAVVDGVGANKKVYFTSRLSFHKFMGGSDGIDVSLYDVRVEGDITLLGGNEGVEAFGNEFKWTFEGWGWDQ